MKGRTPTPTPIIQTPQPTQAGWVGTTYTYTQSHPHAVTALSTGSSYQYDANGNMTCRVENSITYKQTYNAENRISNIMKMNGDCSTGTIVESWSFAYDGDGTRTGQVYTNIGTGSSLTTMYFMSGVYETTDDTSTVTVKKYYAIAGMTVAMNDGNGMKYLLTDHLGSVVTVTDSSGTVLSQQRYLPFGQVRTDVGNISQTDFGYTGQRSLDNGLMDYHARFYDAALGRFTQPDTIIASEVDPQSWNRYSYVYNNPIDLADPTGNFGNCRDNSGYSCKITQNKVQALEGQWQADVIAKDKAEGAKRTNFCVNNPVACSGLSSVSGNASSSGGGLDFTGYSDWEKQILQTVYIKGGPDAVRGVNYMLANNIHIKVGEQFVVYAPNPNGDTYAGDWPTIFNVGGWYERPDYVVLSPDNRVGQMPNNWELSIIIHEAYHIEQGEYLAKSDLGEMQAGQIGIGVYAKLEGKTPNELVGWIYDAYHATSVNAYHDAYKGQSYWWNLFILPCNPGEHPLCQ